VSRAFRPPSTFEKYANVQFYLNDIPLRKRTMSSGNVQSEQVMSRELGYLGDFPQWKLNLDARLFNEQMVGLITQVDNGFKDYTNNDNFSIKGLEYQMKWSPWAGGQLMLNQSYTNISSLNLDRALAAPRLLNSLAFFQKFEKGLVLSLMHQNSTPSILAGSDEEFKRRALRSDLRISLPMRFGAQKGEVAMVVQNLGSPYFDFHHDFQFERRAFVTFRVEH
jgi:iron complex outermembrane receptor protein